MKYKNYLTELRHDCPQACIGGERPRPGTVAPLAGVVRQRALVEGRMVEVPRGNREPGET